jgi:hypothetical protein
LSDTRDRGFGLFWLALGLAIFFESWRMPRLEEQGINPYTVPGLVPGLLGLILAVFGVALFFRRAPAAAEIDLEGSDGGQAEPWRVALAFVLCVGFGAFALGHGPPFWLASGVFLFLAIILFEWPEHRAEGTLRYGLIRAALVGVVGSAAITFIFQEIFLVRLP